MRLISFNRPPEVGHLATHTAFVWTLVPRNCKIASIYKWQRLTWLHHGIDIIRNDSFTERRSHTPGLPYKMERENPNEIGKFWKPFKFKRRRKLMHVARPSLIIY